jgi:hypothetical protein
MRAATELGRPIAVESFPSTEREIVNESEWRMRPPAAAAAVVVVR